MMNGKDIQTGEPVPGVEQPETEPLPGVHHPIAEAPGGYGDLSATPENLADLDTPAPTDLPEATDDWGSENSGDEDLDSINLGGGELGEENLSDEDMGDAETDFGDDNSDFGDDDDDMEDFGNDSDGDDGEFGD